LVKTYGNLRHRFPDKLSKGMNVTIEKDIFTALEKNNIKTQV